MVAAASPDDTVQSSSLLDFLIRKRYCCLMPRSRRWRVLAIALLLLGGAIEPVWMIGHAVQHLGIAHDDHGTSEHANTELVAPVHNVVEVHAGRDHPHPITVSPARQAQSFAAQFSVLPGQVELLLTGYFLAVHAPSAHLLARASPAHIVSTRPRAPPLT